MKTPFHSTLGAALVVVVLSGTVAMSSDVEGLRLDMTTMSFDYQVTNPQASQGDVIGTLLIRDEVALASEAAVQHVNLGQDNVFGGGGVNADTVLDLARIQDPTLYDMRLGGADPVDIASRATVRYLGPGQYQIEGMLTLTDTGASLGAPSFQGEFISTDVSLMFGNFFLNGSLSALPGGSLLLPPSLAGDWVYQGVAGHTEDFPDGITFGGSDGVDGTVTLETVQLSYVSADLSAGHFIGFENLFMNLDTYFSANRWSVAHSLKVESTGVPVPEPVSALLAMLGLVVLKRRRRSA